jgi:hypothetical protein
MEEARALRRSLEERGVKRVWCVAVLAATKTVWANHPTAPPAERKTIDANAVRYPTSILVHSFVGLEPVSVAAEFRQDWVGGERVLLEIPRATWIDPDSLPSVEIQREPPGDEHRRRRRHGKADQQCENGPGARGRKRLRAVWILLASLFLLAVVLIWALSSGVRLRRSRHLLENPALWDRVRCPPSRRWPESTPRGSTGP